MVANLTKTGIHLLKIEKLLQGIIQKKSLSDSCVLLSCVFSKRSVILGFSWKNFEKGAFFKTLEF